MTGKYFSSIFSSSRHGVRLAFVSRLSSTFFHFVIMLKLSNSTIFRDALTSYCRGLYSTRHKILQPFQGRRKFSAKSSDKPNGTN